MSVVPIMRGESSSTAPTPTIDRMMNSPSPIKNRVVLLILSLYFFNGRYTVSFFARFESGML